MKTNEKAKIPDDAIRASEEARRPLRRGWKENVAPRATKGDPFSEDRVSKTTPTKDEVHEMPPDDAVFPG